mgnify:FL=1
MKINIKFSNKKISQYENDTKDWPTDREYMAYRALEAIKEGSGNFHGIAAEDDQNNLIAIAAFQIMGKDSVTKILKFRSAARNAISDLGGNANYEKYTDKLKDKYGSLEYTDKVIDKYSTVTDEFIDTMPDKATYIHYLAGIGVGGAGYIMKILLQASNMIVLEMDLVGKNMSFYKHFGFQRFEKTKWMYYLK